MVDMSVSTSKKLKLPRKAKELWPGKCHTNEHVADFFRRVWKKYINHGLTLAYLKEKDLRLFNAINSYTAVYEKPWPEDCRLRNYQNRLANAFQRLAERGARSVTPDELIAIGRKLKRDSKHQPAPR
jgi:hypothetical protein